MSSWANRRKLVYALLLLTFVVLLIGIPAWKVFYKAPTCVDRIMNGDETGVDCGGSCKRLCQNTFIPPRIEWGGAKFEKVADGLYNASAYIVNPNISGGAIDVPYRISLYDNEGIIISERNGKMNLYPRRNSLAFQTAIKTDKRIPTKATFEFISSPTWFKSTDLLEGISIIDKKYNEDENGSSLEVSLENKTLIPYKDVQVGVVLYDGEDNVIGFSQTKIDNLAPKNQREVAPFTWPAGRDGRVAKIEVITSIKPVPIPIR